MIITVLLLQNLLQVGAVRCYFCNTQYPNTSYVREDPCIEVDPLASQNYGECQPDSLCSKMVFNHNGMITITRACSASTSRDGYAHRVGCGRLRFPLTQNKDTYSDDETSCFCDTDLCNGNQRVMPTIIIFILTFILFVQ